MSEGLWRSRFWGDGYNRADETFQYHFNNTFTSSARGQLLLLHPLQVPQDLDPQEIPTLNIPEPSFFLLKVAPVNPCPATAPEPAPQTQEQEASGAS